jgi:hypothetical protein
MNKIKNIIINMNKYKRKLVSFCIWGDGDLYNLGLLENAIQMPKIFPGWIMHVSYTPTANQKIMNEIAKFPWVEIEIYQEPNHSKNTMHRFLAGMKPNNDIVIFRDADSRLLKRDYMAVMDWLNNTDKKVHLMRDHPANKFRIMAGLWGVRDGIIAKPEIVQKFYDYYKNPEFEKWTIDQVYLQKYIYPLIEHTTCIHASFNNFEPWAKPFPKGCPPRKYGFCGQTFHYAPEASKKMKIKNVELGKKRII